MDLISRLEMFWLQELQQGIRPSLILYSSDQILEDYLSTGAEPRVKGQNIVKKCLFESLRYKSLNCKPSLQTITAALEILASELSLVLYKPDEESSNSLTICGEVFVLDIHIESDGSISTVKLAASELNEIPDEAHEYLTKLAKDLDLFAFEKELAMFSFLDKTNGHHPQLNLFNCILGLQRDIAKIYELECRSESPKSVLLYGHGETKFYERNFGASITYHATQSMDDYDLPSLYFANISVEKSTLNHFLPKTIQQSCFDSSVGILPTEEQFYSKSTIEVLNGQIEVLSPNSNSSLSFNAAFVMELEPAVSLSLEMAKAIIGISGVSVTDQNLTNWTGPTFEEEYQSMKSTNYKFSCASVTPMFIASKIFFSGINQVLPIFKILRQAVVFRRIVSSILHSPHQHSKTIFHFSSWSPPRFVQIYFAHKKAPFRYLVDMTVIENGTLEVEVTANAGVGTKLHIDNELFQQGLEALDGSKILQSIISFLDQQL